MLFSTIFIRNNSYCKKIWARYLQNVYWFLCKVPVILVRFLINFQFSRQIFENTHISNFVTIRLVGVEFFHVNGQTDRRTDMTKLIVTFRNSANVLKKDVVKNNSLNRCLTFLAFRKFCLYNLFKKRQGMEFFLTIH